MRKLFKSAKLETLELHTPYVCSHHTSLKQYTAIIMSICANLFIACVSELYHAIQLNILSLFQYFAYIECMNDKSYHKHIEITPC